MGKVRLMKIELEIPDEFKEHWNMDHFEDSFKRINSDVLFAMREAVVPSCGLYERELLAMLINAVHKKNNNI